MLHNFHETLHLCECSPEQRAGLDAYYAEHAAWTVRDRAAREARKGEERAAWRAQPWWKRWAVTAGAGAFALLLFVVIFGYLVVVLMTDVVGR